MIKIEKVDHVGLRIKNRDISTKFYELLGFKLLTDVGFDHGHPIIMRHESGVVLNLLGPSDNPINENILMDVEKKYAGYTHIALKISSVSNARSLFAKNNIAITEQFNFKGIQSIFIRDPDRNVIEFTEYEGKDPFSQLLSSEEKENINNKLH